MIYYERGGKQVQHGMEWYYEAPHHAGVIRGASSDPPEQISKRYPGAVLKRGRWAPDDWYREVMATAHAATWE